MPLSRHLLDACLEIECSRPNRPPRGGKISLGSPWTGLVGPIESLILSYRRLVGRT